MEQAADEIRRLKTCSSDPVGILGFRAIWSGGDPSHIVSTLLDVLVGTLRLDFAYARHHDPIGGASVEQVRTNQQRGQTMRGPEFGRLLDAWLRDLAHAALLRVPNPMGCGDVSIVAVRLGLRDEMGVLVAGSSRADFPLQTERILLNVAANQAAIGLHDGRRPDGAGHGDRCREHSLSLGPLALGDLSFQLPERASAWRWYAQIVTAFQGAIDVKTAPREGSTFSVHIPLGDGQGA